MHTRPAPPRSGRWSAAGFTLMELALVIAIIAALASLVIPTYGYYMRRAEDARCMANLRALHAALSGYMTEHNQVWPQYPDAGKDTEVSPQAKWWYDTLKPYGPTRKTWLCATHGNASGDENDPNDYDFSYIPTPFDETPNIAYQYLQPWVIEFGGYHEGQANQVMPDGSLRKQENPLPPKAK